MYDTAYKNGGGMETRLTNAMVVPYISEEVKYMIPFGIVFTRDVYVLYP